MTLSSDEREYMSAPNYQVAQSVIVWIPVASVIPAPWNPVGRTNKGAVRDIVGSIQERGWVDHCSLKIGSDGILGDGHRRLTGAKIAGLDKVTAIFCSQTARELWALNVGSRQVSNAEWMAVYATTELMAGELPSRIRSWILELEQIVGSEGMRLLVERNISPDVLKTVDLIRRYTKRIETKFLRAAVYWLVKHRAVRWVMGATRAPRSVIEPEPIPPQLLVQLIENDQPPPRLRWEV